MVDKPQILCDHRDWDRALDEHRWAEQIQDALPDTSVDIGALPLGDISWKGYDSFPNLMEIKRVDDLIDSMKTERFQDEVARMIEQSQGIESALHVMIVGRFTADATGMYVYDLVEPTIPMIEAKMSYRGDSEVRQKSPPSWYGGWRPYSMVVTYLASIQELGIAVHHTTPERFGLTFGALWRRSQKSKHHVPARRRVTILSDDVQALTAIGRGAGRGVTTPAAQNLMKHFGTFLNVMNAEVGDLVQVDGVGPKSARVLYERVRREWKR